MDKPDFTKFDERLKETRDRYEEERHQLLKERNEALYLNAADILYAQWHMSGDEGRNHIRDLKQQEEDIQETYRRKLKALRDFYLAEKSVIRKQYDRALKEYKLAGGLTATDARKALDIVKEFLVLNKKDGFRYACSPNHYIEVRLHPRTDDHGETE